MSASWLAPSMPTPASPPATFAASSPRFSPENLSGNLALIALIKAWAERKACTLAQLSLAWLLAQRPWTVPIPGTTQMAHMLDNIGAASVTLTPSEVVELNVAVSAIAIVGERLPAATLAFSGVEAAAK